MQKCIIDCNKCTKKVCYFCKNCERWDKYTGEITQLIPLKSGRNPGNCSHWLCNNVLDYCAPSILARHFPVYEDIELVEVMNDAIISMKKTRRKLTLTEIILMVMFGIFLLSLIILLFVE